MKYIVNICFGMLIFSALTAQEVIKNTHLLIPNYSFQIPAGDLADRFGVNSALGFAYKYKFNKNWLLGANVNFLFGQNIKEKGIYDAITTSQDFFIDRNGLINEFSLQERGFTAKVDFGKIIWSPEKSPNSGIFVSFGLGYMQHRISINLSADDFPQVGEDLRKGYDRFSSGFMANQTIGYLFLKPDKFINFYVGLELFEGLTKLRRPWVFDLNSGDKSIRFDILTGIKVGWIIPVFKKSIGQEEEYFYN